MSARYGFGFQGQTSDGCCDVAVLLLSLVLFPESYKMDTVSLLPSIFPHKSVICYNHLNYLHTVISLSLHFILYLSRNN